MNVWIIALVAALAVGSSAQDCACETMKWADCRGSPCQCQLPTKDGTQQLDCTALIPKCFLLKAEMLRRAKGQDTRSVGKPETGFVDNDGIYDPDCESNGAFKAKQCNKTEECWCVNSAGVRRTEKEDKNLKCEKLVETYWIRLILDHAPVANKLDAGSLKSAIGEAIQKRYKFDANLVKTIEYDADGKRIQVDIQKEKNNTVIHLADMAYYIERDIKKTPLFKIQDKFEPQVGNQKLNLTNIVVYYVDVEPPTFKMNRLAGGVIAAIVVVLLIVAAGLLLLFFWNRSRKGKKYNQAQQQSDREMENK